MQNLSNDELFHFALEANKSDRHDIAIGYLKQLIESDPEHEQGLFLLGAEYAQVGLFNEAIKHMEKVVGLTSTLPMANFQLGLLYMAMEEPAKAKASWETVLKSGDDDYIYVFSQALIRLVSNHQDEAKILLQEGLELSNDSDLNTQMENVLNAIGNVEMVPTAKEEATIDAAPEEEENTNQLFLSMYQNTH